MDLNRLLRLGVFLSSACFSLLDIASDFWLAKEYFLTSKCADHFTPGRCPNISQYANASLVDFFQEHFVFFTLTSLWISLGGALQFLLILRYLCKKDSSLDPFPWPIRIIIVLAAPILGAPIIVNLFGVYLVWRNPATLNEDVVK